MLSFRHSVIAFTLFIGVGSVIGPHIFLALSHLCNLAIVGI